MSQSMDDEQHSDKNRFEWPASCNREICSENIVAPSFADNHLQHFYEVKVEEMDLKQEISDELDGDVADLKVTKESISENEMLTSSIKNMHVNSDVGVSKVPLRICHRYPSVVECPACDKSYKRGSNRLPCLLKHITKFHPSDANKLCRQILLDFKKRNSCNCAWFQMAWASYGMSKREKNISVTKNLYNASNTGAAVLNPTELLLRHPVSDPVTCEFDIRSRNRKDAGKRNRFY